MRLLGLFPDPFGKSSAIPLTVMDNALVHVSQDRGTAVSSPVDRQLFLPQSPSKRQKLAKRKRSENILWSNPSFCQIKVQTNDVICPRSDSQLVCWKMLDQYPYFHPQLMINKSHCVTVQHNICICDSLYTFPS